MRDNRKPALPPVPARQFSDDDAGYLRWVSDHPDGFVLNVERGLRPGYTVLHRATCRTIATSRDDGAYTERGYRKVVANDIADLRSFIRKLGRADGSFSKACGHCRPPIGQAGPVQQQATPHMSLDLEGPLF